MSDHLAAVAVDCYAGAPGDETPRRFTRGDQLIETLEVVDQWRTPDHRYFRVRTADETYTLRQDVTSGGWELTEVGWGDASATRVGRIRRGPRLVWRELVGRYSEAKVDLLPDLDLSSGMSSRRFPGASVPAMPLRSRD